MIPKGFFPQEDTGLITGGIVADQSISFQLMKDKLVQLMNIVQADPAVRERRRIHGRRQRRRRLADQYRFRVRPAQAAVGAQDIVRRGDRASAYQACAGARRDGCSCRRFKTSASARRQSNAQYPVHAAGRQRARSVYVGSEARRRPADQPGGRGREFGPATKRSGDRGELRPQPPRRGSGLTVGEIDSTLYDAFGQRQVSTIYNALNQYHVVMEVAPRYWQSPAMLEDMYVSTSGGAASGTQTTNSSTHGGRRQRARPVRPSATRSRTR